MKAEFIIILCIILVPVLVLSGAMTGSLLSSDNSNSLGNSFITSISKFTSYMSSLSDKATKLYDFVFSGEPMQPNEDLSFYSKNEQKLMVDWEKDNDSMSSWQGWTLSMKYFFKINVDTDSWNSEYNWSFNNPYLKYKT